jgi:2-oxo-3-hexenedioate decarboxylase
VSADVEQLAARLSKAVAERTAIEPLTDEVPDLDLETGYAVQRVLREQAGPLAGWKLGVTSRAKQAQVGVSAPVCGFLPAAAALDLGEPLSVSSATAGLAVGIEILDSRFRDYRFTMADVVADNTSAARYLVGTPVPPAGIDVRLVGVVLEKNGELVATASGAASLGHPAAAVAWLVRRLAASGEGLEAGEVVLSGGLTAATPVTAGDVVTVSIDRLGTVELGCAM